MTVVTFVLLIFFTHLYKSECVRILAVFPTPSISHQIVFRPIVQELARKGHEVTVVTTDPAFTKGKAPANLTEIDIHEVSYAFKKYFFATSANNDAKSQVQNIHYLLPEIFVAILKTNEIKNLIDGRRQFDLLLLEACFRETLVFSHLFQVPVIQISSFGTLEHNNYAVGSALHPIYYPSVLYHRKIGNLSFQERIHAIYNQYVYQEIVDSYEELENTMLKKHFGPDLPSLNELANNVHLLLLNVHPIWENNKPVPPNVVYLGGLPQKHEKKLPKDLMAYLDASKFGVIYMSFGTNVNSSLLPIEKVQVFQKVFSELPYDVLWKWDENEMAGKPNNVRIEKWFPQPDLLKHPNLKLFITQGGLQSIDETIIAGVPIIGIPIWVDQFYNVEKCVQYGIGVKLELEDIEENILTKNIKATIQDKRFVKNVAKLRSMVYDKPQTALERAIYWIEYVIKHGGARHLRSPAANLSWTEYYQMDLVCFLLLVLLVMMTVIASVLFVLTKNSKKKSLYKVTLFDK